MNGDWNTYHSVDQLRMRYPSDFIIRWASTLRRGIAVLDIGCGTGRNSHFLVKEGFAVRACDPSDTARRYVKSTSVLQAENCPATKLTYHDQSFDAALCTSVFFYLPPADTVAALREAWRILKPGGKYLFNVRTVNDGRANGHVPEAEKHMPMFFWPEAEMRIAVKNAGFVCDDFGRLTLTMQNRHDDEWIIYGVKP